jgi:hypothetical protein
MTTSHRDLKNACEIKGVLILFLSSGRRSLCFNRVLIGYTIDLTSGMVSRRVQRVAPLKIHDSPHTIGFGGVSERPKERASKARVEETQPWVQIPPPPPDRTATSAEDEGFEPSIGFPIHAFQACALGRYANPPLTLRPKPSRKGAV